jgi:hypothetical protein
MGNKKIYLEACENFHESINLLIQSHERHRQKFSIHNFFHKDFLTYPQAFFPRNSAIPGFY